MKIFKWNLTLVKTPVLVNGSMEINEKFAEKYADKYLTQLSYLKSRIPVIKKLREAHSEKYGHPSSLKSTKDWLDDHYNYNLIRDIFN